MAERIYDKEANDRGLKDVLDAFDTCCRPKRNETVERFIFSVPKQNPDEIDNINIYNLPLITNIEK